MVIRIARFPAWFWTTPATAFPAKPWVRLGEKFAVSTVSESQGRWGCTVWLLLPSRVPHPIPSKLCTPEPPGLSSRVQHTLAFMLRERRSAGCSVSLCCLAEPQPVPTGAAGTVRRHQCAAGLAATADLVSLVSEFLGWVERENNPKGSVVSS